jgi:hypothetical protein
VMQVVVLGHVYRIIYNIPNMIVLSTDLCIILLPLPVDSDVASQPFAKSRAES